MKSSRLTRRQFFKLSVLGTGMLGTGALALPATTLAGTARAPSSAGQATASSAILTPHTLAVPQPTFNPIASALPFGEPVDISMGWDGALWAIDATGAPNRFNPISNQWSLFGTGIDAVALVNGRVHLFRGSQTTSADALTKQTEPPVEIASKWPALPDSFKLGVDGAAAVGDTLYLLKGGWFVPTDGSQAPARLLDLKSWPTTAPWQDGLFDAVISGLSQVWLFRGAQYLEINFERRTASSPKPISDWKQSIPSDWIASGFDAGFYDDSPVGYRIFNGPATSFNNGAPRYVAEVFTDWPATWNPILHHAPNGRASSLWSVSKTSPTAPSGIVCQFDGESWNLFAGTQSNSVAMGQDGTVIYADAHTAQVWQQSGASWRVIATAPQPLQQVSVGDADHIWARDIDNAVYSVATAGGALTPAAQVGTATHMAANADGTLWHCDNSPTVFRLISESAAPSSATPVQTAVVAGVQKVASAGFGVAHVLTKNTDGTSGVYRYDSPYLFKTSRSYNTGLSIEHGLGLLFLAANDEPTGGRGVSLDAHTGQQIALSQAIPNGQLTDFVFDPIHELVYAGFAPLAGSGLTAGGVNAYDARTLQLKWSFATPGGVSAKPALNGTQLCFADAATHVYCFDTRQTLNQVAANQPAQPSWQTQLDPSQGPDPNAPSAILSSTPLIAAGRVYIQLWAFYGANTIALVQSFDIADGGNVATWVGKFQTGISPSMVRDIQPILGTLSATQTNPDGSTSPVHVPAIWVNNGPTVAAYVITSEVPGSVALPGPTPSGTAEAPYLFALPSGSVSTGLVWDDGTREGSGLANDGPTHQPGLWFGDTLGNLWGLGDNFQLLPHTPQRSAAGAVYSTPILYKDPQGGLTVLYSNVLDDASADGAQSVTGFDPDNGLSAGIATGVTSIYALSRDANNGVIYAGGSTAVAGAISQVFGIRIDSLPQTLRDFVIESQMMQDPDENAPGGNPADPDNPIPPSRARYQTHITVVDDAKNPQPNEPVKVWADAATTILCDGVAYNIGPDDAQFAALQTGVDGTLVVTSGYSLSDGSDTPDLYAAPLRVWAGFMNPYERMVINPDLEFHQRISTAHAEAGDDDPDKVNLITATAYAGTAYSATPTPLFTADEQSAGQPSNCAQAIAQMNSGVGFGSSNTTANIAQVARAAATLPPYVAYSNLSALTYFATNVPSTRPIQIAVATGLIMTKPDGAPGTQATFSAVHHTDAQAALDALPAPTANPPWETAAALRGQNMRPSSRADNVFKDFWEWLKKTAQTIAVDVTHVIVTIAKDVMVGIRVLVKGVEQVFKAVVKVIDDIASAIGSFFTMISKAVEDVVSALSTLFNFGQIMWTHRWLAGQVESRVNDLLNGIKTYVQPAIDNFFEGAEDAVKARFDQMRADLQTNSGNPQINNTKGMGQTTHSTFNVGPQGQPPSSHATQCTWGTQKLKSGSKSAATSSPASRTQRANPPTGTADDPVADFFTGFLARLTGDGDLADAVQQLKTDFSNLFKASSAKQFFSTLLVGLLDLVETLVLGALALANAFVDGLLGIIDAAIGAVMTLMTDEIQIPVLTWLYEKLFKEPLTLLNLVTLVAAIPVTVIFRVVEGQYPQQAGLPTNDTMGTMDTMQRASRRAARINQPRPQQAQAASALAQKILGTFAGIIQLALGIMNAANDSDAENTFPALDKIIIVGGLLVESFTFPLIGNDASAVSSDDWFVYGFGVFSTLLGLLPLSSLGPAKGPNIPQAIIGCVLALVSVAADIIAFIGDGKRNGIADAGFASELIGDIVNLLNPLKYGGTVAVAILVVVDIIGGIAEAFITVITAYVSNDTALPPNAKRWHLPMVVAPTQAFP